MYTIKQAICCFAIAFALIFSTALTTLAADGVSNRLQMQENGITQWHIGAGYFLPKDGDLNGGPIVGMGFEYTLDKDTVFGELLYSPTGQNIGISSFSGDVKNYIAELGYMTDFGKFNKWRLGTGLQLHQMEFGSSNRKRTKLTVLALAEYDLFKHWKIRLQSSQVARSGDIRFGGYDFKFFYVVR